MRFQVDPRPDETQRACRAIVQASLPRSHGDVVLVVVIAAVVIAAFVLTPTTVNKTAAIAVGGVFLTVVGLQLAGRARLRHLRTNDPHALETHFIELGPDGVHTWCAHIDARYPWQDFTKVTENDEFVLFVRGSGNGSAIPKRLLDESTNRELRRSIGEWLGDRANALVAS